MDELTVKIDQLQRQEISSAEFATYLAQHYIPCDELAEMQLRKLFLIKEKGQA